MADRFKGNHVESYIHASDHVAMWSKGRSVPDATQKRAVAALTKALMKEGENMRPPEMDVLCCRAAQDLRRRVVRLVRRTEPGKTQQRRRVAIHHPTGGSLPSVPCR